MKKILITISFFLNIFSSQAQQTWIPTAGPGFNPNCLFALGNDTLYAGTASQNDGKLFYTIDQGNTWTLSGTFPFVLNAITKNKNGYLFVATHRFGVYRSADNGTSWTRIDQGELPDFFFTNSMISISNGRLLLGGIISDNNGLYVSDDNGTNWEKITSGLPENISEVNSLVETNYGTLLLGTYKGMYRSTDHGDSWTYSGNGLDSTQINAIAVFRETLIPEGILYAAGGGKFFRSYDDGVNWDSTSFNKGVISSLAINTKGEVFAGSGGIFVAQPIGAYRSTNGGQTWEEINTGLKSKNVTCLGVDKQDVFFAGLGDTTVVYRHESSSPSGIKSINKIIDLSIYPNPSSGEINIKTKADFEINKIKLISIDGKEIFVSKKIDCAEKINLNFCPSGFYFLEIYSNDGKFVERITLQR